MISAVITVAGLSSRFNKDLNRNMLKSIYYEKNPQKTLLYHLLETCNGADRIVIVGGYLYDTLYQYIHTFCHEWEDKIILVNNTYYAERGSAYSLLLGIQALVDFRQVDEMWFIEGDLYFDKCSFSKFETYKTNVLTINRQPIYSSTAVILYLDSDGKPHYLYNQEHGTLKIEEAFMAVFHSGQAWKLTDFDLLKDVCAKLSDKQISGTNLEIIQSYFDRVPLNRMETVMLENWINCNTLSDYYTIFGGKAE